MADEANRQRHSLQLTTNAFPKLDLIKTKGYLYLKNKILLFCIINVKLRLIPIGFIQVLLGHLLKLEIDKMFQSKNQNYL